MSMDGGANRERGPRRARYLIPKGTPNRAQVVAAIGTVLVLVHLLALQLTGVIAIVLYLLTRVTRWRSSWLWAPVAVGVLLVLAVGPAEAVAGFLSGPRQILGFLAGVGKGAEPGRLWRLGDAFAGAATWLPAQAPLALIAGAGEAAIACWLRWLHTDEWRLPEPRPGLIVALRRIVVTRQIHAGGVVTKDGATLGVVRATGRRAAVSWEEAENGVLITGVRGSGKTTTAFQLVHAAIRRRKPVIAVDLTGSPELIARTRDACAATGTPFHLFGADGPGWYEPLRTGDPARHAALVTGMVNWTGTGEQYRRTCTNYLQDLLSVVEAAPGDTRTSMLDEITHLLDPEALKARAAQVPDYHQGRQALLDRVQVSASAVAADPQATAGLRNELTELYGSSIGRRLRPDPHGTGEHDIDLSRVVHERGVVLFSLDAAVTGHAAGAVAGLIAQDVLALGQELRRIGVPGDGLVWLDGAEPVSADVLAELAGRGREAGLAAVMTTSAAPPDRLLDAVGTHVVHRVTDRVLAQRFAAMSGERLVPGTPVAGPEQGQGGYAASGPPNQSGPVPQPAYARRPVIVPEEFGERTPGEFTLLVAAPRRRMVPLARTVRSRIGATKVAAAPEAETPESGPVPPSPADPDAPVRPPAPDPSERPRPVPPPPGPEHPAPPPGHDRPAPPSRPDSPAPPFPGPDHLAPPPSPRPPRPSGPGRDPRDAPPMPPQGGRRPGSTPPSGGDRRNP